MKRFSLLLISLLAACFSAGCAAMMQTSVKIQEDRDYYYFPEPQEAVEAYELNGTLYLRCPVAKYVYRNPWFQVCMTPATWGDAYSHFAGECDPAEYVWIYRRACKERANREKDLSFVYDPAAQNPDEKLKQAKKIPVKSIVHPLFGYNHGGSFRTEYSYAFLPQIRHGSENGFWRTTLAVADGIQIDFPVSLVMTLTGSFWYIPLTEL